MAGHTPWSKLKKNMSPERRARVEELYQQKKVGLLVAEMRKQSGLTQAELAERIGRGQSTLSEMESSGDMRITTLNLIVKELGGSVVVHLPDGDIPLTPLASD